MSTVSLIQRFLKETPEEITDGAADNGKAWMVREGTGLLKMNMFG